VLKLISIHAEEGDELEVFAEGPDAEEALEAFEATAHRCALDWAERLASQTDH
jgi:phosphotransferase system HPr-like phosphotransfer protein